MKLLVVHDRQGKIRSVSVPAAQQPGFEGRLGLKPGPDEIVSEVDGSDIQGDKIHEYVREIVADYWIVDHPTKPRLVKK